MSHTTCYSILRDTVKAHSSVGVLVMEVLEQNSQLLDWQSIILCPGRFESHKSPADVIRSLYFNAYNHLIRILSTYKNDTLSLIIQQFNYLTSYKKDIVSCDVNVFESHKSPADVIRSLYFNAYNHMICILSTHYNFENLHCIINTSLVIPCHTAHI